MKKKAILTILFIMLLTVQTACAGKILSISLDVYKNDSVTVQSIQLDEGNPTFYTAEGDYRLELAGSGGEVLYDVSIDLAFMIFTDPPSPIDPAPLKLRIDYLEGMEELLLYKSDELIFSTKIRLCNDDGLCDIGFENYLTCPGDCPPEEVDGLCLPEADGGCDPDCLEGVDPDCISDVTSTEPEPTLSTSTTASPEETSTTEPEESVPTTLAVIVGCGDGVCDYPGENYETCPSDCPAGGVDDYCDGIKDGVCDPDCVEGGLDKDCESSRGIIGFIPYLAVFLVLLVILYVLRKKLNERKIDREREEFLKWKEEGFK